ncbi:YnbE family lipoprotein [Acerihabitans arboris]|uniref:YnbE family lipoprotein n=1 Tax=Acerihabitans arboris TaxID=2691583 RepID=A0A845SI73_9GAMM|nr:YnbE family lipoprotein [Acerihabitans arboris]NDL62358.1 YnbE family lipoprotein [Acerihabitans arboris]
MKTGYKLAALLLALNAGACVPRIELAMPEEPITINMNVKIEHDINIKADKQSVALLQPTLCEASRSCTAAK